MATIAKATLFMLLLCRCFSLEQLYREAQGSIKYDRVLVGHVIATFKTQGFLSCAHICLTYPSCKSYNYYTAAGSNGICEINSDEGNLEDHFDIQPGSLFGQMRKIQVTRAEFLLTLYCKRSYLSMTFFMIEN